MKHTISVLVENQPGVLARISGLFSARGYNITSLAVGETEISDVSRMTIVVDGDNRVLEQITKQLNKLVDVLKVIDFTKEKHIERDLALIKVNCVNARRKELLDIVKIFRAKVVDVNPKFLIIEMVGTEDKIAALVDNFKSFGIIEMVRTGTIAVTRGKSR
jgi:acetolactate synthase-1/3 small subunit